MIRTTLVGLVAGLALAGLAGAQEEDPFADDADPFAEDEDPFAEYEAAAGPEANLTEDDDHADAGEGNGESGPPTENDPPGEKGSPGFGLVGLFAIGAAALLLRRR